MPRPEQVPAPRYQRSPELPYGTVGPANAGAPRQGRTSAPTRTAGPAGGGQASPEQDFLFGPTLRPNEPLTAGAPFGPGSMMMMGVETETDRDFMARVVSGFTATSPGAPEELQGFLERVKLGL